MAKQTEPRPSAIFMRDQVLKKEVNVAFFAREALARIARLDAKLEALLHDCSEFGEQELKRLEKSVAAADIDSLPLAGVPIVVKDNIAVSGLPLTCGSKILGNFVASYDATVIKRLREAGAIIVGKANMDEFAMGSSTENSAFKTTKNPWDLSRVPGGSSGGSAAAVAAKYVPFALGSDTGGSVRQPASFCGVVGHKPTYGRMSRYGLVAYASSLDQIGPIAGTVADAALLFDVTSGFDRLDATSQAIYPKGTAMQAIAASPLEHTSPAKKLRIGYIREHMHDELNQDIKAAVKQALLEYEKLGAEIVELSLPQLSHSISCYYLIATAEASSNLSRFDGIRYGLSKMEEAESLEQLYSYSRGEGFGAEVKRRILLGTFALSAGYKNAYYEKALRVRELIRQDFARAFTQVDLLLTATSPAPAFRIGSKEHDPMAMYLEDIFTVPVNLAGVPALALNCAYSSEGLPIGMQLIGPHGSDERLFASAYLYEQVTRGGQREPEFC